MIKMQTFLCDGNPDLRLDGVLAGAKVHLDAQMLLNPFEEKLHLQALVVQVGDQFWLQGKVGGQKYQALARGVLDHHPAQRRGLVPFRKIGRKSHFEQLVQARDVLDLEFAR